MYTKEEINLIILSGFTDLSYSDLKSLLNNFETAEPDFAKHKKFLIKTLPDGVYNKVKRLYGDGDFRKNFIAELDGKGIKCVTYFSDGYPETLKNIYSPPMVLYCKGDVSLLKTDSLSIVGSRRTLPKAIADCRKIAGEAAKKLTVVSGIADGADRAALEGALDAGGKVISVMANGFDRIYPAANKDLAKRVEARGLLVSEYPPEVQAKPYFFPFRNRIIAGLSKGTLVISAGKRSGALITADYATEFGRDVFAFPYSINIPSGEGCNSLIKKGASLTENILDIFSAFRLDFNTPAKKEELSGNELEVYTAVKELGEAFLPEVAKSVGKLPHEVIPVIYLLQIKNKVVSLGGNRYSAL